MPVDQLFSPMVRGPLYTKASSASDQWCGKSTISSGDTTVTISTTNVNSNSVILLGNAITTAQDSGVNLAGIEVCSIDSGNWFAVGTTHGQATVRDRAFYWLMIKTS